MTINDAIRHPVKLLLICGALLLLLAGEALAHGYKAGPLTIDHPYAVATPRLARTGAVYFTIVNTGPTVDRLIAAASDRAETVELHTHQHDGAVVRMRAVPAIEIAPGARVGPDEGHVMLIGLKGPLTIGEKFPMTLTFANQGTIAVEIVVQRTRSDGASEHQHQHPVGE